MDSLAHAALVCFDEKSGPKVAWTTPPTELPAEVTKQLAFVCLDEATLDADEQPTLFVLYSEQGIPYFGASLMRSDRGGGGERARQRAVALVSRYPAFDVLESRLSTLALLVLASDAARDSPEIASLLAGARVLDPPGADYANAIQLEPLMALAPRSVLLLLRMSLLQGRIVFFSKRQAKGSRCALALASLIPAHLSLGVAGLGPSEVPRLGASTFGWARQGLPLRLESTLLAPALPLALASRLLEQEELPSSWATVVQKTNKKWSSYCVATTNAMLAKTLGERADLIVDLDTGVLRRGRQGRLLEAADCHDRDSNALFEALLLYGRKGVTSSFVGSDVWVRAECSKWILATLTAAQKWSSRASGIDYWLDGLLGRTTGTKWLEALARSPVFESWAGAEEQEEAVLSASGGTYDGSTWTSSDGLTEYTGEWREDAPHGMGTLRRPHADVVEECEGEFVCGNFRSGEVRLSDGSLNYRGDFDDRGLRSGAGSLLCEPRRCPSNIKWTRYVGEWRCGKRHGVGHCSYVDGSVYSGDWFEDEEQGQGTLIKGSCTTVGSFSNGRVHGVATLTTVNGDVYEGRFENGQMDPASSFILCYADGRRYAGALRNGAPSGAGLMREAGGDVYEGQFADGLRSGEGTLIRADDAPLKGQWRCDTFVGSIVVKRTDLLDVLATDDDESSKGGRRREGDTLWLLADEEGVVNDDDLVRKKQYRNGDVYEGEFAENGQREGNGTFRSADGAFFYDGDFQGGKPSGYGVAHFRGKCSYDGHWTEGLFHGHGKLIDSACNLYEGEFQSGRKEGVGTQTYADESTYSGEWRDGKRSGTGHSVSCDKTSCYSGFWAEDEPCGEGVLSTDGATHEGLFARGKPSGWGTLSGGGERREGVWVDGEPREDGEWSLTYETAGRKKSYRGRIREGLAHGQGVCKWSNGESYSGEFKAGLRAGRGIGVFPTGEMYNGDWEDDHISLNGSGELTLVPGSSSSSSSHKPTTRPPSSSKPTDSEEHETVR